MQSGHLWRRGGSSRLEHLVYAQHLALAPPLIANHHHISPPGLGARQGVVQLPLPSAAVAVVDDVVAIVAVASLACHIADKAVHNKNTFNT